MRYDLRETIGILLMLTIVIVLIWLMTRYDPNQIFCPECGYKTRERSHYVYCPYDGTKLKEYKKEK